MKNLAVHTSRANWADIAKGLAIILIVLGHVLRGLDTAGMIRNEHWFVVLDSFLYVFHVPAFFFLAGYFLADSLKHGINSYIKNKMLWIFYPFVLWSYLQGSINVIFSSYTNKSMSWSALNDIIINPIGQFWFLQVLFGLQLLYLLVRQIDNRIILVSTYALWAVAHYTDFDVAWFRSATFLVLGLLAKQYGNFFIQFIEKNFTNLCLSSVLAMGIFLWSEINYADPVTLPVTLLMISLLLTASIRLNSGQIGRILTFIGLASMAILVMHILAGSGTRIILIKLVHLHNVPIHILVGTLCGTLLPLIAYITLHLIPHSLNILGLRESIVVQKFIQTFRKN